MRTEHILANVVAEPPVATGGVRVASEIEPLVGNCHRHRLMDTSTEPVDGNR